MLTIHEKESLFESLDERFTEIKTYVESAVGQAALHEVELHLFRRLQRLGRSLWSALSRYRVRAMKPDQPRFPPMDGP